MQQCCCLGAPVFEELDEVAVSSVDDLLKTPLHHWHAANHGRMVEFAGWSMPVQYGSIIDEHHQTRNAVGMFDVSHMGRLYFSGTGVDQFLDRLTTRRVAGVEAGKIRYSLMTNDDGGILDDVLVYHLPDLDGNSFHMMVVNASNRAKIVDWIESKSDLAEPGFQLDDRTQSDRDDCDPRSASQSGRRANLSKPIRNRWRTTRGQRRAYWGSKPILSRTGYTGEDGCELIVDADDAETIWSRDF